MGDPGASGGLSEEPRQHHECCVPTRAALKEGPPGDPPCVPSDLHATWPVGTRGRPATSAPLIRSGLSPEAGVPRQRCGWGQGPPRPPPQAQATPTQDAGVCEGPLARVEAVGAQVGRHHLLDQRLQAQVVLRHAPGLVHPLREGEGRKVTGQPVTPSRARRSSEATTNGPTHPLSPVLAPMVRATAPSLSRRLSSWNL